MLLDDNMTPYEDFQFKT